MEKYSEEKSHEEIVAEIDAEVRKMEKELLAEGYNFKLTIPDASTVIVRVGGEDHSFTKKKWYDIKDEKGNLDKREMKDVIADRIRQLG